MMPNDQGTTHHIAETPLRGFPILSEDAQSRIQAAEIAAGKKLEDARRYLEQVAEAKNLLASLEFSLGASAKRRELEDESTSFLMKAARIVHTAAGNLFDAHATEYWDAVERDANKFAPMLSAIRETVELAVGCPELAQTISIKTNQQITAWTSRISTEDPRAAVQIPEPPPPLPPYWENPTPLFYVETWDFRALTQRDFFPTAMHAQSNRADRSRGQVETAARTAIELHAGRALTDAQWAAERARLRDFAGILRAWDRKTTATRRGNVVEVLCQPEP